MRDTAYDNQSQIVSNPELPTVLHLVSGLTDVQQQRLRVFTAKRLGRLDKNAASGRCLAGVTPDDIVHDALQRLLLGDTHSGKGRKVTARNRSNPEAFVQCVMGVINSIVANAVRSVEFSILHLTLADAGEPGGVELRDPIDAVKRLEHRDLQRELFARLRQQAGAELLPIIDDWELRYFSDDTLARNGYDRRQVYQVRKLAQQILRTLASEFHPHPVCGMEMIM